jgi:PAS domain-containing protein
LEKVDRDLNLVNSTLTNCAITTSAACTFTGTFSFKRTVLAKTANYTVLEADSGKIIQVNPAGTTLIQLPEAAAVGAGWNITVVLTEDDGGAMDQIVNIGTHAGEFFNGIIVGGDAGGSVVANGTSNDFIQCKATATSGERFDIYSDGTRMHATGIVIDVSDTLFADAAAA